MRIEYFADTDSLYIEFAGRPGADALEVADGIVIDVDGEGHPVGIELDQASIRLDLRTLDLRHVPYRAEQVAGRALLTPRPTGPQGPPLPPSAYEDIPGLPPFEPDSIEYEPGGLEIIWYWVRNLFRRRPHDRAA